VHIPGVENTVADKISRWVDRTDWQLHPHLFWEIMKRTVRCEVDAFASAKNHLLDRFWSYFHEHGCEAVNFFAQNLQGVKLWMNPPFNLIGRVLMEVQRQGAEGVILVPQWESKPWWPVLMAMAVCPPIQVPLMYDTFRPMLQNNSRGVGVPRWPLVAVHLSGDPRTQQRARQVWGPSPFPHDASLVRDYGHIMQKHATRDENTLWRQRRPWVEAPW